MSDRITEQAHRLVRQRVAAGDIVVDATAGNGHDTAFLAELVGAEGKVIGFDVQEAAIVATSRAIPEDLRAAVELHCLGHEHMAAVVAVPVRAVMFNLGYLPGSDKEVVTEPETTVAALEATLEMLSPGGVVTVVVYPGHEGGRAEADAVEGWVRSLDGDAFQIMENGRADAAQEAPYLVAVEVR